MMGFWILLSTNILSSFVVNEIINFQSPSNGSFPMEIPLITLQSLNALSIFAAKCYCFQFNDNKHVRSRKIPCFAKISSLCIWKKIFHHITVYPFHPSFTSTFTSVFKDYGWIREWSYNFRQITINYCWVFFFLTKEDIVPIIFVFTSSKINAFY